MVEFGAGVFSSSDEVFVAAVLGVASLVILSDILTSFKLMVAFGLLLALILQIRVKTIWLSFFLVAVFTLPFFNPNKYYTIEVIRGAEIALTEFKEGYYLGYGLHVSNVMLGFALGFLIKSVLFDKSEKILAVLQKKYVLFPLLSLVVFALVGLLSSLRFSFAPAASVTWLIQYCQIIVYAFFILLIGVTEKKKISLFFSCLAVMVAFQAFLSIHQFLIQSHTGHVIEFGQGSAFYTGGDENNSLFRVAGTFLFHNQFALLQLVLTVLYLPIFLRSLTTSKGILVILGLVTAFLAQSRVTWIALVLLYLLIIVTYKAQVQKYVKNINSTFIVYVCIFAVLFAFVAVPRVLLSFNTFTPGSSGTVRLKMLEEATEAVTLSPLVGFGVGTNEYVLHGLFPQGVMSVFPAAVHLGYLQMVLEVGLTGVFFFFMPFFFLIRTVINNRCLVSTKHELVDHSFRYLAGCLIFFIYYLFQPHVGIVEFPFLGIVLGFGLLSRHGITRK